MGEITNMKTLATLHAEQKKELDEKFSCTTLDCDGEGTYSSGNGDPTPCRYCHEFRIPQKTLLNTYLLSQIDLMIEIVESPQMASGVMLDQRGRRFIDMNDLLGYLQAQRKLIEEQ
jgi:hypothetical protein